MRLRDWLGVGREGLLVGDGVPRDDPDEDGVPRDEPLPVNEISLGSMRACGRIKIRSLQIRCFRLDANVLVSLPYQKGSGHAEANWTEKLSIGY